MKKSIILIALILVGCGKKNEENPPHEEDNVQSIDGMVIKNTANLEEFRKKGETVVQQYSEIRNKFDLDQIPESVPPSSVSTSSMFMLFEDIYSHDSEGVELYNTQLCDLNSQVKDQNFQMCTYINEYSQKIMCSISKKTDKIKVICKMLESTDNQSAEEANAKRTPLLYAKYFFDRQYTTCEQLFSGLSTLFDMHLSDFYKYRKTLDTGKFESPDFKLYPLELENTAIAYRYNGDYNTLKMYIDGTLLGSANNSSYGLQNSSNMTDAKGGSTKNLSRFYFDEQKKTFTYNAKLDTIEGFTSVNSVTDYILSFEFEPTLEIRGRYHSKNNAQVISWELNSYVIKKENSISIKNSLKTKEKTINWGRNILRTSRGCIVLNTNENT